jgi:hypothetical protein
MVLCIECGSQNPDSARFCLQCGAPLTPPPDTKPHFDMPSTSPEHLSPRDSKHLGAHIGKMGGGRGFSRQVPSTLVSLALVVLTILVATWFWIDPGVFTVQPIAALPQGVTFIYYSRDPNMPFFSSPDGMCLETQGYVSLLCRFNALGAANDLNNRLILKLPYLHWAYLMSTGGREFEQ